MRKTMIFWLAAILAVTSGSIFISRPAAAADPTTSMDCTQAESMLDAAVSAKASTIMTGDVDKDFATLMMLHEKVGQRIDQIEAKCGKNVKMQTMAAKGSEGAEQRMEMFRNLGTSQ